MADDERIEVSGGWRGGGEPICNAMLKEEGHHHYCGLTVDHDGEPHECAGCGHTWAVVLVSTTQPIDLRKARFGLEQLRQIIMGGETVVEDVRLAPMLAKISEIEGHVGGRYEP